MIFSKFIKLVTHFVRFPVDILLWPVSVLFGWCHGIIKMHAMVTVTEVCASFVLSCQNTNTPADHLGIASRCRLFRFGENGQAALKVPRSTTLLRREGIHGEDASHSRLYEQTSGGSLKPILDGMNKPTAVKFLVHISSIFSSSIHHDCNTAKSNYDGFFESRDELDVWVVYCLKSTFGGHGIFGLGTFGLFLGPADTLWAAWEGILS